MERNKNMGDNKWLGMKQIKGVKVVNINHKMRMPLSTDKYDKYVPFHAMCHLEYRVLYIT